MNAQPQAGTALRRLASILALAAVVAPLSAASDDGAKTHTLFMGADISVGKGKELYPVKDVVGSSWIVDVHGNDQSISTKEGPLNIRVLPSLKLTEASATVANLKSEKGYTFENDPTTRQTRALAHAADLNAGYQASLSQTQASVVQAQNAATSLRSASGVSGDAFNAAHAPGSAAGYAFATGHQTPSDVTTPGMVQSINQAASSAGSDLEMPAGSAGGFDAMDVAFDVSSERPLNNPYLVTVTRFHPNGTGPGVVQNMVYSKALDPIGTQPTHVHLVEGGFPGGFEVVDFQVHLYDRGQEIATTVSPKRVPLTRDEAFEYVKMEYEGAHKADTLPAVAVMGRLPPDLPARLAEGKYGGTYYARVSKEGIAGEVFLDAACTRRVADPYLESLVKDIRFKPALAKGKPVDSVAPLSFADLRI